MSSPDWRSSYEGLSEQLNALSGHYHELMVEHLKKQHCIHDTPVLSCPRCEKVLSLTLGKAPMKTGDIAVCFYCAEPLEFRDGLSLVPIPLTDLPPRDRAEVRKLIDAVRANGFGE